MNVSNAKIPTRLIISEKVLKRCFHKGKFTRTLLILGKDKYFLKNNLYY